jgi:hypothetical protein
MIHTPQPQLIYKIGELCEYHRDLENNKAGCIQNGKRYGENFYCDRHAKKLGFKVKK